MQVPISVSAQQAACMVLAGAALAEPRARSSAASVAHMVRRLAYVQVDSIVAVERAHDTILRTRLAGYRPEHLRKAMERDRAIFEHWTHDASLVPVEWLPYWHRRFRRYQTRLRHNGWWQARTGNRGSRLLREVLQRVERDGPIRTRDLVSTLAPTARHPRGSNAVAGTEPAGGWWNWSPEKAALESLWRMGRIAVSHRHGFEKAYDLFERVHPERAQPAASATEHLHWACAEALARLGVATPTEIAHFFADVKSADVQRWARTARARAVAVPVLRECMGGGRPQPALAWRAHLDAPRPEPEGIRILSPFDPVVRDRQRLERLWGFDYRFEAFVPAHKRVDGYYTLPVLEGARFIGRCTLRADRAGKGLILERWRSHGRATALPRAVRTALGEFAAEIGLSRLVVAPGAATVRA